MPGRDGGAEVSGNPSLFHFVEQEREQPGAGDGGDIPDNEAGNKIGEAEIIRGQGPRRVQGVFHEHFPNRRIDGDSGVTDGINYAHPCRDDFEEVFGVDHMYGSRL